MFSIENHSDPPSCSSSKASDLVVAAAGDEPQPPNFSIRDYVFKSRSKDIGANWPFPEQLLHLCMDNGIRDILPPFETPSLVRARCFGKQESEQLPICSENKQFQENEDPEEEQFVPLDSVELTILSLAKERREVKVHQGASNARIDHPMASNICPVCKSFTATSNTTLNAHIDRCLSSDQSNATLANANECSKLKVKPGKKRLMVDIYATAPYCTLEELDRRNGTDWAASLSVVTPANVVTDLEPKRTELSLSNTVNRGNLGDIYVDSNGTKILILSKANDSPPSILREKFKPKKIGNSIDKKKSLKPNYSEFMKDDPQEKKLRVVNEFKDKIEVEREDDDMVEAQQKKEVSVEGQVKNNERAILGHWVCSKRSALSRKPNDKDISKGSESMAVTAKKLSVKLMKPNSGNSSFERGHALNFSRSTKAIASFPKTKRADILYDTEKSMDSARKGSQPSNPEVALLAGGADDENPASLNEARKSSTLKKRAFAKSTFFSPESMKGVRNKKLVTAKKFQKHISISGLRDGKYSNDDGRCHCPPKDFDLISSRDSKVHKNSTSSFSTKKEQRNLGMVNLNRRCETAALISDKILDLDPIPEEHEESVSGDESRIESPSERSADDNVLSSEIISRSIDLVGQPEAIVHHIVSETDTAFINQEPHPCFTNSSTTSARVRSHQDHNKIVDTESSSSPHSTTSAVSEARNDNEVKLKEPSCSCSQSLFRESQFTNKTASNLFIKPSILSSFDPGPSLESPTESVVTMVSSSKSAVNSSNPILRLMGKDLVVNKEETFTDLDYSSKAKFFAFGPNYGEFGCNSYYQYHNHQMHLQPHHQNRNFASLPQTVPIPNIAASQRLFACFPSQNPCANSEGTPFMFPSPSSKYFSSTRR